MSGIAGVVAASGGPGQERVVRLMLDRLSHRGCDGGVLERRGPITLGQVSRPTTPEAAYETWPLSAVESPLLLVADARIDNRAELLAELGLPSDRDRVITDGDLVLASYQRWGSDALERLVGDFAMALWDGASRHLVLARDPVGVRPLFYLVTPSGSLLFASEPGAIRAACRHDPSLPSIEASEGELMAFLNGAASDPKNTLFEGIRRLLPGEALRWTDGAPPECWTYAALDPTKEITFASDEACAAAFLERFDEAVRCRMRSCVPTGAFLSGGLDSSSIVATARELRKRGADYEEPLPFPTVSHVYDRYTSCDERAFIRAVVDQGGVAPTYVPVDDVGPLDGIDDLLAVHDGPFLAPNLSTTWLTLPDVRARGIGVLLHGHGGDEAVSHGHARMADLARTHRWIALAREARGLAQGTDDLSAWELWRRCVWGAALRPWIRRHRWLRRLVRLGERLYRSNTASGETPSPSSIGAKDENDSVQDAQSEPSNSDAGALRDGAATDSARAAHYEQLTAPGFGVALEVLDRTFQARGIDVRFPFLDWRLLQFCLALPADQKLRLGWGRFILRSAMKDRLPESVRLRRDKVDFTHHVVDGLQKRAPEIAAWCAESDYLDSKAMMDLTGVLQSNPSSLSGRCVFAIWKAAVLARWERGCRDLHEGAIALSPSSLDSTRLTHDND